MTFCGTPARPGAEGQLRIYRDKLDEALQLLARNPNMGHHRADLPETHRLYLVVSHVIVYREIDSAIAVVRILHQRMSLARHL